MRRSLAWNVIGVTVLVIVLMFTAGEVRFYSVNAGYTGEILRKHSIFSKLEAEQISARISEVASGLGVLARLQSEGVIAGDAETFSYLKSMLYMDKSADSVLLLDAGGAVVDAYPVQPGLSGIDMSNQEYYTGLMVDPIVNTTKTESLFEPYAAYAIDGVHPFSVSCGLKSLYFLI